MKSCKHCASPNHTNFRCYLKPNKPLTGKRRIKRIGRVGRQWIATRKEWIQKNIPDSGVWNCFYCGIELHLNELTLDHKKSRSRHPELRFELTNLVPSCLECNTQKGSKDAEEFMEATCQ